jgi:hypothetical protein
VSANYTFSPATVNVSGNSPGTTNLVLTAYVTNAKTSSTLNARNHRPASPHASWYIAGSGTALGCLLFFGVPRRRRWTPLLVLVLSIGAISVSGCGGSSSSTPSNPPTQTNAAPGTYTINVTATTTAGLVHTTQLTFTVTQ